jgi:hypothetical protein
MRLPVLCIESSSLPTTKWNSRWRWDSLAVTSSSSSSLFKKVLTAVRLLQKNRVCLFFGFSCVFVITWGYLRNGNEETIPGWRPSFFLQTFGEEEEGETSNNLVPLNRNYPQCCDPVWGKRQKERERLLPFFTSCVFLFLGIRGYFRGRSESKR